MIQQENAISVSELNEYVRRALAGDLLLRNVTVTGEISGWLKAASGHCYFTLKDERARVACVMYRQDAWNLSFRPEDGNRVRICASASVYVPNGTYQLIVKSMEQVGTGLLYMKFEQLKRKLEKEGLFDPGIKRELPAVPRCIGIVTSLKGAAVRDMVRISRRRNPNINILIAPCSVQGADSVQEIIDSIELLNRDGRPDVLLIGRGGGSIEDLWSFNEEAVARAIAASGIPTVSCVGHETDFTIADFVADRRAATPSMAAEIAVPVIDDLRENAQRMLKRVGAGLINANRLRRAELNRIAGSAALREPCKILIGSRMEKTEILIKRCEAAETALLREKKIKLDKLAGTLKALNPASVLERGYAYVTNGEEYVTGAAQAETGSSISIFFSDGRADATVTNKIMENKYGEENEL